MLLLSSTWASISSTVEALRVTEQKPSDGFASPPHREMQAPLQH
jgi:hypothetical protein